MGPQRPRRGRSSCPACFHKGQHCKPDCIFALYFSDPAVFANVHRLFGYANTVRLLQQVEPGSRAEAAKSITWEAQMWRRSPVPGCLAYQTLLEQQITQEMKELDAVRGMIEEHRRQQHLNLDGIGMQHALPDNNSLPDPGGNYHHMHASSSTSPAATSVEEGRNMQHLNQNHEEFETRSPNSGGSGGGC